MKKIYKYISVFSLIGIVVVVLSKTAVIDVKVLEGINTETILIVLFLIFIYTTLSMVLSSSKGIKTMLSAINGTSVKNGFQTVGIIKGFEQTGIYINRNPQMLITLDILTKEQTKMEVSLKHVVALSEIHSLNVGKYLTVIYDVEDPSNCAVDTNPNVENTELQLNVLMGFDNPYSVSVEDIKSYKEKGVAAFAIVKDIQMDGEIVKGDPVAIVEVELQNEVEGVEKVLRKKMLLTSNIRDAVVLGKVVNIMVLKEKPTTYLLQIS